MGHLFEILKQDWPQLVFVVAGLSFIFLIEFLSDKLRQRQLSRIAARHGYDFIEKDTSNAAPFFENFLPVMPYRRYQVDSVANIMPGTIEGIDFIYFEQSLSLAPGVYIGSTKGDGYTRSVVAVNTSGYDDFEVKLATNQEINMKQMGDWIYFWQSERKVIPVKKVERFLAEITDTVKVGLGKTMI
jgi:hypothetical protein